MRAGKLQWRMKLYRPALVKDSMGDQTATYVEVAEVMAGDEPLSLKATAAILGVTAGQVTTANLRWITIRHRDDIVEGWQVARVFGARAGIAMDVVAVREGDRPDEMHLIARFFRA